MKFIFQPATIPQGVIDMNRVLEVSEAEDVTGNQYSLAITAPDRVTFVKGTCREESRWWYDVLAVFPTAQKVRDFTVNSIFNPILTGMVLICISVNILILLFITVKYKNYKKFKVRFNLKL